MTKDETDEIYEEVVKTKAESERQHDTLSQTEHVREARKKAFAASWAWVEKRGVPFFIPLFISVVVLILIITALSVLAIWLAYVGYLVGWVENLRVKDIESFLEKVYSFVGGGATALLFYLNYLNRKPRQ